MPPLRFVKSSPIDCTEVPLIVVGVAIPVVTSVAKLGSVVYINMVVVLSPPGFTVPFKCALNAVTFEAGCPNGMGEAVGGGSVVKVPIVEFVTPEELLPTTRT